MGFTILLGILQIQTIDEFETLRPGRHPFVLSDCNKLIQELFFYEMELY